MNPDSTRAASALLQDLWQRGDVIPMLPVTMRPQSRADGYAIQALLEARDASPLYGWKIAATSIAGQQHINVDGPIAGRILASRVVVDGGTVPPGPNRMSVAEVEFAFRMGRDLPPRHEPYGVDEVVDAVASLHAAIEVPDSRYSDFTRVGAAQLIADNACAHWFVAADAAPADWRSIDLAMHRVTGRVIRNGQVVLEREGAGASALGDPRIALTWLANELSSLGIVLAKGRMVTTGTCVQPLEMRPGDEITAELGSIGRAVVRIG